MKNIFLLLLLQGFVCSILLAVESEGFAAETSEDAGSDDGDVFQAATQVCSICLNIGTSVDPLGVIIWGCPDVEHDECSHKFHAGCILLWLESDGNGSCPDCRYQRVDPLATKYGSAATSVQQDILYRDSIARNSSRVRGFMQHKLVVHR